MKKNESVKEMYNRMKKITNQIKSLGGDKWGDREIVDKLLTMYMARDVTLPSLIRAERGFKHFTAKNVLGRIEAHHDQLRRVKINQDLAELQEQAAKNNGIALQVSSKGKEKENQSSNNEESSHEEDDELDDEKIALFIKNFRRVFRKGNFRNYCKNKGKHEPRRRSNKPYFGCSQIRFEVQNKNCDRVFGSVVAVNYLCHLEKFHSEIRIAGLPSSLRIGYCCLGAIGFSFYLEVCMPFRSFQARHQILSQLDQLEESKYEKRIPIQ